MPDYPSDLQELLAELEGKAIHTSQGSFLRLEDVRGLMDRKKKQDEEAQSRPQPKTVEEARAAIRRDPEIMKHFPGGLIREPSHAVPASEPQPASRP